LKIIILRTSNHTKYYHFRCCCT